MTLRTHHGHSNSHQKHTNHHATIASTMWQKVRKFSKVFRNRLEVKEPRRRFDEVNAADITNGCVSFLLLWKVHILHEFTPPSMHSYHPCIHTTHAFTPPMRSHHLCIHIIHAFTSSMHSHHPCTHTIHAFTSSMHFQQTKASTECIVAVMRDAHTTVLTTRARLIDLYARLYAI